MKKKKAKQKKGGRMRRVVSEAELHERCREIARLTEAFCEAHLNDEYCELSWDVIDALLDVGFPLERGDAVGWAAGIVHALGWVNFLHDPSQSPHKKPAELAEGFGVSQGMMTAKSKQIRDALDMIQLDPNWCLSSMLDDNPLVWMLEVNGLIMDIRLAPREAQEQAYRMGLIPYIPADREEPAAQPEPDTEPNILSFPSNQNKPPDSDPPDKSQEDTPGLFDNLQQ
jgi:hypothetical protein